MAWLFKMTPHRPEIDVPLVSFVRSGDRILDLNSWNKTRELLLTLCLYHMIPASRLIFRQHFAARTQRVFMDGINTEVGTLTKQVKVCAHTAHTTWTHQAN